MHAQVLQEAGMRNALRGKVLVSLVGGMSEVQLGQLLGQHEAGEGMIESGCIISPVVANTAMHSRSGVTVIAKCSRERASNDTVKRSVPCLICAGRAGVIPPVGNNGGCFDARSLIAGVLLGIPCCAGSHLGFEKAQAVEVLALAIRGAADLLFVGDVPIDALISQVATAGGSTMADLRVLRDSGLDLRCKHRLRTSV